MAQKQNMKPGTTKKKTSIGNGKFTKRGSPGPNGGNRHYKKKYRGQGR
jgi:hypothetical protein